MRDVRKVVKNSEAAAAGHAQHDRALVARYAARDAYPAEIAQARQLLEGCAGCARLADDIRLLTSAVAALPTPSRPRDFRLSTEQAERLRGSAFERALRGLLAPGLVSLRPLAGVAMSIGLLLAVVGAALPLPAGVAPMAVSEDGQERLDEDPSVAGEPASQPETDDPAPAEYAPGAPVEEGPPAASTPGSQPAVPGNGGETAGAPSERPQEPTAVEGQTAGSASPAPAALSPLEGTDARAASDSALADGTRTVLVWGGLALAALSLGVLLLAIVARRRLRDPLLR